jgi:hypothetical protein
VRSDYDGGGREVAADGQLMHLGAKARAGASKYNRRGAARKTQRAKRKKLNGREK